MVDIVTDIRVIRKLFTADLLVEAPSGAVPDAEEWWRGATLVVDGDPGMLTVKTPFDQADLPEDAELTLEVEDIDGEDNPFAGFSAGPWTADTMSADVEFALTPDGAGSAAFVLTLSSAKNGLLAKDRVRVGVLRVNLLVDSLNQYGFGVPVDSEAVEAIEDNDSKPGKIVLVNDGDVDADGIVDYADGFDRFADASEDDQSSGVSFVPVVFEIPEPIDVAEAVVNLSYSASDPGAVTTNELGVYVLPSGNLRLWAKDGSEQRSTNAVWRVVAPGDYLPPTPSEGVPATELGFSNSQRSLTFYLEAVIPSATQGDQQIVFTVDPDGDGPLGSICNDAARVTAVKVEFIYAEGDRTGETMDHLPVFTPSVGTDAGVPDYGIIESDLRFVLPSAMNTNAIDTLTLTYLGVDYVVHETGVNSLCFTNDIVSLALSECIVAEPDTPEHVVATISGPFGIIDATYTCFRDSAFIYSNVPYGIVLSLSDLDTVAVDHMQLNLTSWLQSDDDDFSLLETSLNSLIFTNSSASVFLVDSADLTSGIDILLVSITGIGGLSNTVFSVTETAPLSRIFRNYAPAMPTSIPDTSVPSFVPWRVKIHGFSDPDNLNSFSLSTSVDISVDATFNTVASLVSDQAYILISFTADEQLIPDGYHLLRVDDRDIQWKVVGDKDVFGAMQLANMPALMDVVEIKAQPGAVVLQSLPWKDSVGRGLDCESRVREVLLRMGYSCVKDYNAKRAKTLSDYVKGKQIWYSMSHGGTDNGKPWGMFTGLGFTDGEIRASDLSALGLNYRLVIADGCCSAQTSLDEWNARTDWKFSTGALEFMQAWGPDAAYMGWSWSLNPGDAQAFTEDFISNLEFDASINRARTVMEAYEKCERDNIMHPLVRYMRIYGNMSNVIDQRKKK